MTVLLATFETEAALRAARRQALASGIAGIETYTPVALSEDESGRGSPIPTVMFGIGMLGFVGVFALMTYADVVAYPLNIGGRPRFSWPAFVPIAFELGVLFAMTAGFVAYILLGRLLDVYRPVDDTHDLRTASRDLWLLELRDGDPERLAAARGALGAAGALRVEDVA